jgi:hypothetical protein
VHVLVFDAAGNVFLQKRSMLKDLSPGLWDFVLLRALSTLARTTMPPRGGSWARKSACGVGVRTR